MELSRTELIEDFKPYKTMMEYPYIKSTEKQIKRTIYRLEEKLKGFHWHAEYEAELFEAKLELISRN